MPRRIPALPLALVLTAALAAPLQAAPDLVVALGPAPERGFDPLYGWGETGDPLIQSALWRRGSDGAPIGELATEWHLSPDRLTWTLTLREDARFSDGTPLTATDVAFTFTTASRAAGSRDLRPFSHAEVLSPTSVALHLSRPALTFTEHFFNLGILPAASYGADYGHAPLGSGPYLLRDWQAGEQAIFEVNPFYFGDKPEFDRITFLLSDKSAGVMAARAGAAQLVQLPLGEADVTAAGMHVLSRASVDNRGISLPTRAPETLDGTAIGNAVTADPAIRAAINLGLDRDALVTLALGAHGRPAFGPGDGLAWDGESPLPHDPAAAAALLDGAGWLMGPDGVRAKDGLRAALPLYYPASDPLRQKLAEISAVMLAPLGIAFTPQGASWDAIAAVMAREPVVFGFGSQSPRQLSELFRSDLAGQGWLNPTWFADPALDNLLAAAEAAPDLQTANALWAQSFAISGNHGAQGWAWLVNLDHLYLVDDCLQLGEAPLAPHMHGWPVTDSIRDWQWICE